MEAILWICIGLFAIACCAVVHTVRQHNKMFNDNEDPVPYDDMPGHYDDYEFSERPFYNP